MAVSNFTTTVPVADTAYGNIANVEPSVSVEVVTDIKTIVQNSFNDTPVMIEIARCESQFNQFDSNGKVLKNSHSSAKGVFQIMESLHKEPALKLGFDIYTVEGNIGYARYLYEKQGTRPWNASAHCWDPERKIAMR